MGGAAPLLYPWKFRDWLTMYRFSSATLADSGAKNAWLPFSFLYLLVMSYSEVQNLSNHTNYYISNILGCVVLAKYK